MEGVVRSRGAKPSRRKADFVENLPESVAASSVVLAQRGRTGASSRTAEGHIKPIVQQVREHLKDVSAAA